MVKKLLTKQPLRIGVFGGTFDPVHIGHTQSAQAAAQELNLSQILFIPAYIPPHKSSVANSPAASPKNRGLMVALACDENALFTCDLRELQRQQHSYTIDTLLDLKKEFPQAHLYFIIGMDSLLTFTAWHRYDDILKHCNLVVNTRPNYCVDQLNKATKALLIKHQIADTTKLDQADVGAIIFTKPMDLDISSTQIRKVLQDNSRDGTHNQVALFASVLDFISKNKLYR